MVNRLKNENPDKMVQLLSPFACLCSTMYRIHPAYLLWVLEGLMANDLTQLLPEGFLINPPDTSERHGGHGTPTATVVEEVTAAGFRVVRGPERWRG